MRFVYKKFAAVFWLFYVVIYTSAAKLPPLGQDDSLEDGANHTETVAGKGLATGSGELDENLQSWLENYYLRDPYVELNSKQFNELLLNEDSLTRAYAFLGWQNAGKPLTKEQLDEVNALVQLAKLGAIFENSPLWPDFLNELLNSKNLINNSEKQLIRDSLVKNYAGTCAAKDYVLQQASTTKNSNTLQTIESILAYKNSFFRYQALAELAKNVEPSKREKLAPSLIKLSEENKNFHRRVPWLKKIVDQQAHYVSEIDLVEQHNAKRNCKSAFHQLKIVLQKEPLKSDWNGSLELIKSVDQCYKKSSLEKRIAFWDSLTTFAEANFSKDQWALLRLELSTVYRVRDEFEKALNIIWEAKLSLDPASKVMPELLFGEAYVHEQAYEFDKALDVYQQYIKVGKGDARYIEALKNMALIYTHHENWDKVIEQSDAILEFLKGKTVDERDVTDEGFALFWKARSLISKREIEHAHTILVELISKYYSTYYGAMGHYLAEKISKNKLPISRKVEKKLVVLDLVEDFQGVEKLRVKRILKQLTLGLQENVSCELRELEIDDDNQNHKNNRKVLFKSLLGHANGNWLMSIKNFGDLPRSFRHKLPYGYEKILFPKKYDEKIELYAQRAKIDPDFVNALIRQESIFNPNSLSGAGAYGIMQIMPTTAKLESKKIKNTYLSSSVKDLLIKKLNHSKKALYDVETNLSVGIHYVKRLLEMQAEPITVLASYNAGPNAVGRWLKELKHDDLLLFTEQIPYKETQNYVKLVLRNYFYYKKWYGKDDITLEYIDEVMDQHLHQTDPIVPASSSSPL